MLEVRRGDTIIQGCASLQDRVAFASYLPAFCGKKVITMEWMEGTPLMEYDFEGKEAFRNEIGQALWDFYDLQLHDMRLTHADPHPGNFLITDDGRLGVLDFGCVKEMPESFYNAYFQLIRPENLSDDHRLLSILKELQIVLENDDAKAIDFYTSHFREAIGLLSRPFYTDSFDFADEDYFKKIFASGENFALQAHEKGFSSARGSKHILYLNRTLFGLFSILNQLKANIRTRSRFFAR
jgi:predicted unusual protein kinase regulating ubiquinone biosynthesis (AarF/ABC1/UbiB family)